MKLIATDMGFYKGRRVRPGAAFEFDGKDCPKWAVPAGEPPKPAKPAKATGDTKPADAAAAVKAKTGGYNTTA